MPFTDTQNTIIADLANAEGLYGGDGPALDWNPVVAHDVNAQVGFPCRFLRATGAGNIAVLTPKGGVTARVMAFAAGETRRGIFLRVMATSTTATGIEAGT